MSTDTHRRSARPERRRAGARARRRLRRRSSISTWPAATCAGRARWRRSPAPASAPGHAWRPSSSACTPTTAPACRRPSPPRRPTARRAPRDLRVVWPDGAHALVRRALAPGARRAGRPDDRRHRAPDRRRARRAGADALPGRRQRGARRVAGHGAHAGHDRRAVRARPRRLVLDRSSSDADGELRNVAVAHVDPGQVELAQRMRERYPPRSRAAPGPRRSSEPASRCSGPDHRGADGRGRARRRAPRADPLARPDVGADRAAARPRARARRDHARAHRRAPELRRGRRRLRGGGGRARRARPRQRAPVRRGARAGSATRARRRRCSTRSSARRRSARASSTPTSATSASTTRWREINGVPAIDHSGARVREVLPGLATDIEAALEEVLATGEAIVDLQLVGETPREPGRDRHYVASYYPVALARGETPGHRHHRRRRHRPRRGGAGPARAARPLRGAHARTERARPGLRAARRRPHRLRQRRDRGPHRAQRAPALRAALDPRRRCPLDVHPRGRPRAWRACATGASRPSRFAPRSSAPTAHGSRSRPPAGAWAGRRSAHGGHRARHHRARGPGARAAARARGRAGRPPRERGRARPRAAAGRHQRAARALAERATTRCRRWPSCWWPASPTRARWTSSISRGHLRRAGADARAPDGRRLRCWPWRAIRRSRARCRPTSRSSSRTPARARCSAAARRSSRSWPTGAPSACSRSAGATPDAGPRATSGASSRRSPSASRSPSTAPFSTASARTWPRRCRPACCPRRCRTSRASTAGRAVRGRRRGDGRRRRLLRRLRPRRRVVDPRHRRRPGQGRRGRGGHRAGALHACAPWPAARPRRRPRSRRSTTRCCASATPTGASSPPCSPASSRTPTAAPGSSWPPAATRRRCCCARAGTPRSCRARARCWASSTTRAASTRRSSWGRGTRWCSTPTG